MGRLPDLYMLYFLYTRWCGNTAKYAVRPLANVGYCKVMGISRAWSDRPNLEEMIFTDRRMY